MQPRGICMLKQTLPFLVVEAVWVLHPGRCWSILIMELYVAAVMTGGLGNKRTRRNHSSALSLISSPFKLKAVMVGTGGCHPVSSLGNIFPTTS